MSRIGFDLGGSKLAAIALDDRGGELERLRRPVPRAYPALLDAFVGMTCALERAHGPSPVVGIGMPGMIAADGRLVRVVNLPWVEGRSIADDLAARLARPVRIANDANCFALSEALDGAAAGARVVFGAILGTGVGGAVVVDGRALPGANAIAGEWGHNPLPPDEEERGLAPPRCACGRAGCIEAWLNGDALLREVRAQGGGARSAVEVAARAATGDPAATRALERYARRLARALAGIINLLDPDVIVVGGGLSAIDRLYAAVPELWRPHVVAPAPATRLVRARHGPDSGLRGAAWLAG
ncbi:MAG TPA: ROK family protein [Geminicoccaceae bacterium]